MIYCRAVLPKAGLANRLFPWARCLVFSHKNNIPMLMPTWSQIRIGPLLRKERDQKFYHNLFKNNGSYVSGIRSLVVQYCSRKAREPEGTEVFEDRNYPPNTLIVFSGYGNYFAGINRWDQLLREKLHAITKDQWLERLSTIPDIPVGIHVRRADFSEAHSYQDFFTKGALRTPLPWFIESLAAIRKLLGFQIDAYVFSDGTEAELEGLLSLKNVQMLRVGSAIGDLLALSSSRILLASGSSSFSAWASFLGQMPTLCHPGNPGQTLEYFNLVNRRGHYVGAFDPSLPPSEALIRQCREALSFRDSQPRLLGFRE
jgi:hypothetical protein